MTTEDATTGKFCLGFDDMAYLGSDTYKNIANKNLERKLVSNMSDGLINDSSEKQ